MGLFTGKKVLVFGLANERSIAWGITQAMQQEGCTHFAFTYVGEALEKRVRPLAESVNAEIIVDCDVSKDEDIAGVFKVVQEKWGSVDVVIHAVAFANREDLEGRYIDTSRAGFALALDISAYSLVAIARAAEPLMGEGGTIVTLSYYGAEKVVQGYNLMGIAKAALEASVRYLAADLGPKGIRINAISAGPIKTLAASGIKGFKNILHYVEEKAPLRRNVTQEDVGKNTLYFCSDLSAGVTGEVLHVDSGYNILGL